jgi:predicted acyl esterase
MTHHSPETTGQDAGAWCADGGAGDWPVDQRAEDGRSLTFTSAPLDAPVEILWFPDVVLEIAADRPQALVAVRLCDVAPDGASLLVTHGLLNLTRRDRPRRERAARARQAVHGPRPPRRDRPARAPPAIACASRCRRRTGRGCGPRPRRSR